MHSLQIAVLLVKVVQIQRTPQAGTSAANHDDVRGRDDQKDAGAAAAGHRVLQEENTQWLEFG